MNGTGNGRPNPDGSGALPIWMSCPDSASRAVDLEVRREAVPLEQSSELSFERDVQSRTVGRTERDAVQQEVLDVKHEHHAAPSALQKAKVCIVDKPFHFRTSERAACRRSGIVTGLDACDARKAA
jgi:hypothetical protein